MSRPSKHKRTVRRTAKNYKSNGWKVRADNLKGYSRPRTINNRRPDVVAKKGQRKRVIEVETPKSLKSDKAQRRAFKKHAKKRGNVTYRTKLTRR